MQRWILMLLALAFIPVNAQAASEVWLPEDDESIQLVAEAALEGSFDHLEFDPVLVAEEAHLADLSSDAAQTVMHDYGVHPNDITGVYWVQPVHDGKRLEEIEIVVVGDQTYYYFPEDGHIEESEPPSITWTNQRYERGRSVVNVIRGARYCHQNELVVTFPPLPTCFFETSPGRYDGIVDAWASSPSCRGCRPSCSGGKCDIAWDGAGYKAGGAFAAVPAAIAGGPPMPASRCRSAGTMPGTSATD